ncbi:hypothetical protein K491DRAFT_712194 [Lophiostoma macrostomum CBS 122681]|uniref:Uncharacterized protein n=1 Tax=Lophiostoma macrostomum CBS 122681 TaxID=1314788 RepID=A0A6A6TLV4_9PLEO|nr:hypothetical protein K491DRAFT_712194 [Lophiostoma macrostomum CBS 122681]
MENSKVQLSELTDKTTLPQRISVIAPEDFHLKVDNLVASPVASEFGAYQDADEPPPPPEFNPLPTIQRYRSNLGNMARDTYRTRISKIRIIDRYLHLKPCVNKLFLESKAHGFDYFKERAYDYCLEMKCFMKVIEAGLKHRPDQDFDVIEWPASELTEGEEEIAMGKAGRLVDNLVWGGSKWVYPRDPQSREKVTRVVE